MPEPPRVRIGDLLVATPELVDPNFAGSVVLLLDLDSDGALGVVLNRPTEVPVGEVLPGWADLARAPGVLFHGGPVATDSALAVGASMGYGMDPDVAAGGFRRLFDDIGLVDLDVPVAAVGPVLDGLRVFAGYAGWGEQQLLDEIAAGSWYVVPSATSDLFGADPAGLWTRVLRRQPGRLAWLATRPADPTEN